MIALRFFHHGFNRGDIFKILIHIIKKSDAHFCAHVDFWLATAPYETFFSNSVSLSKSRLL